MHGDSKLDLCDTGMGHDLLRFLVDIDQMLWCTAIASLIQMIGALTK
jgi:hypothetical protein